jgi:hypothetical protein
LGLPVLLRITNLELSSKACQSWLLDKMFAFSRGTPLMAGARPARGFDRKTPQAIT